MSPKLARELDVAVRRYVALKVAPGDVDDVVQETWLRVQVGLGGLRDDERVGAWVRQVARGAVADHHRRPRREGPLVEEPPAVPPDADDREVAREVASWLRPMLAALNEREREVLELVELEGLSQRALAERLGLSPSGARTRVQRARASLRRVLEQCCAIELDARRRVVGYRPREACCAPGADG